MTKMTTAFVAAVSMLAVSACTTVEQDTAAGAVIGGGLGALTAAAFGANAGWTVVAGAAGATAGALYARNRARNQCAISNGNGTYRVVRC